MKETLARLFGRRRQRSGAGTAAPGRDPSPSAARVDPEVEAFLLRMPKVELQVQLESCLRPARLLSLAVKHGLELPVESEAGVRQLLRFDGFDRRFEIYRLYCRALGDAEDVHLLTLDFLAEQAMQNVLYSEVHVDVASHLRHGIDPGELRRALAEAAADGERRHGIRLRVIAAIAREAGPEAGDQVLEWALADDGGLVAGLGLGGRESEPAAPYRRHFERAAAAGLGVTARAGEQDGPGAVRAVLADCRPRRLAHGVRASEEPALVAELAGGGPPLLICPSANVRCRLYRDLGEHPFETLRRAGVAVSVHTDGGPLHDTNLTREYVRLHQAFGLPPAELAALAAAAVGPAFLPAGDKRALAAELEGQLSRLHVPGG